MTAATDLVVQEDMTPAVTLFGTDNPAEVVRRAANVAATLAALVRKQKLIVRIGQSDHVRVEGWTLLGSMLGVFPVVEWTRPVMDGDAKVGWEARVEARTRGGEVVGAAEAECLRDEKTWRGRDDYALRSMAQTRAVSKAMRLPLGFVMQLAGFSPTPAEEMPQDSSDGRADSQSAERGPARLHADGVLDDQAPGMAARTPEPPPLDDGKFPPLDETIQESATAAQKKKLDVLVGKLRPAHVTTEQLWRGCNLNPELGRGEDGELHWSPLRDGLTREQASQLIERLTVLEATVAAQAAAVAEQVAFPIPESARQ